MALIHEKSSELAHASVQKVEQDGVQSFLRAAANRTFDNSSIILFHLLFGSITRDEMIQRAKQTGRYWEYGSAETITIHNRDTGNIPELFSQYAGTYHTSRPFVCELDGGYLINSPDPLVLTRSGEVVMETEKPLFGPQDRATQADTPFHKRTEYSERTPRNRMRQLCRGYVQSRSWFHEHDRFETAFPLFRRDVSYAHWILDQLPTIRGLRRYQEATGRDPTIVIEPNPPEWVQETLSLVGATNVETLEAPVAKTDRLIVSACREWVPRNQSVYEPSKADLDWLRREMRSRASSASTDYPDRIYLSRENFSGRGRHVANRTELNSLLEEFDIEVCTPETLPIPEQIRLFENADLIIGPHGAALTNMIFSRETCLIEFLNKGYPSYQHIAQLCGHDYHYVDCEGGSGHHTPIEVDIPELRTLLARVNSVTSTTD